VLNLLSGKNLDDRLGFIRKVYAILSIMLTFSFGCIAMTKSIDEVNTFMRGQMILAIVCVFTALIPLIMLQCCMKISRKTPLNYFLLAAVTLLFTYFLCFLTSFYPGPQIVVAGGMTLVMTIALTIFAFNTNADFTMLSNMHLILFLTSGMVGLAWIFIPQNSWWNHLFAGFFVLLYSFYIIWHTQLIAGGKGEELTIDDYAVGAVLLYIDIIYLFMNLLRLIGSAK